MGFPVWRRRRWGPDDPLGFAECGFEHFSLVLDKVGNQGSSRRSHLASHMREPGLIYKESLPFRQNHRPLDDILQLADVARPIICVEEFHRLLVYVSNLLAQFLGVQSTGGPGTRSGPEAMLSTFNRVLRPAFPDLRVDIHDNVAEGDKVTTRKTLYGTNRGEIMALPAPWQARRY